MEHCRTVKWTVQGTIHVTFLVNLSMNLDLFRVVYGIDLFLPYAIEQQESLNLSKSLHCCRIYILGLKYENIFGIAWPQKPCLNGIWIKVTELFMDGIKLGISSTDKKTFIFISDRTI